MTSRNLDPKTYYERLSSDHKPPHVFTGRGKQKFQSWKRKLLPKVLATLGARPQTTAANPELVVEWREDALVKQRWLIDVQPHLSAALLLFRPEKLGRGEKRPAILCCHGHGEYGKDSIMGITSNPDRAAAVQQANYDYGRQMARAGFVTYAIDWLGFGERDSRRKPHHYGAFADRDPCNIHFLCATMLGSTVLASNCHDASRATDFVCSLPFVDPERLGVMGLSYGGTMTMWMTLTDTRFAAADIICYASPFHDMAFATYNCCGSQITPGLYALCDMADLQGLIAPRPLLLEAGIHDSCFLIDPVLGKHWPQLLRIYAAAAAADRLDLDLFPGEHSWGGNRSVTFFRKWLRADWPPGGESVCTSDVAF